MDDAEVRAILRAYRAGDAGEDARFQEAIRRAEADPELARWWADEQELDRIIEAKLQITESPPGLKEYSLDKGMSYCGARTGDV